MCITQLLHEKTPKKKASLFGVQNNLILKMAIFIYNIS